MIDKKGNKYKLSADYEHLHNLLEKHTSDSSIILERLDYPSYMIINSRNDTKTLIQSDSEIYHQIQHLLKSIDFESK